MQIVKSCKTHGQLTLDDVYIRNTRKGYECKWCCKDSAKRRRESDPQKFIEHGRKYRKIEVPIDTNIRKCSGCQRELERSLFANYAWTLRHPYCKSCMSIANHKSKIRNRETYLQYKSKAAESSRRSYLRKTWGITLENFEELRSCQNGICAICNTYSDVLHIDHDHETGKIRALLCNNCNRGIGHMKESESIMLAAIDYLRYHSGKVATQIEATHTTVSQNIITSN